MNAECYARSFAVGHVRFEVKCSDEPLLQAIGAWLADFETDGAAPRPERTIQVALRGVESGRPLPVRVPDEASKMHESDEAAYYLHEGLWIVKAKEVGISFVDRAALRIDAYVYPEKATESLWRLENFLHPLFELMRQEGLYVCHAAGVGRDGVGLMLPGKSGQGKSTLSVHLLHHGFSFLSDDRVFVAKERDGDRVRMYGFYEPAKLFASNVSHLPGLREDARLKGETNPARKNDVDVREYYPNRVAHSAELAGLLFPVWSPGERSRIETVGAGKALLDLLPLTLVCFDPGTAKGQFDFLAQLAKRPAGRMILGDDRERWHGLVADYLNELRRNR